MASIPKIQRILNRIKSIESKIGTLSQNFQFTKPKIPTFKESLISVRKKIESSFPQDKKPQLFEEELKLAYPNEINLPDSLLVLLRSTQKDKEQNISDLLKDIKKASIEEKIKNKLIEKSDWPSLSSKTKKIKIKNFPPPDSLAALIESYKKNEGEGSDWLSKIVRVNPKKIVRYSRFPMQARTAIKFDTLKKIIKKEFPNRGIYITSTMGGRHMSPAHPQGRAIDFVVDRLTRQESKKIAQIAQKVGFRVYNEYIHTSRYKTGDHMHIEI